MCYVAVKSYSENTSSYLPKEKILNLDVTTTDWREKKIIEKISNVDFSALLTS